MDYLSRLKQSQQSFSGNNISSPVSGRPPLPQAPSSTLNITATPNGLAQIIVAWTISVRLDPTAYFKLYRNTPIDNFNTATLLYRGTSQNYTDTNVVPGPTYYYYLELIIPGTNPSNYVMAYATINSPGDYLLIPGLDPSTDVFLINGSNDKITI